jgi:hypothetical protein
MGIERVGERVFCPISHRIRVAGTAKQVKAYHVLFHAVTVLAVIEQCYAVVGL